MPAASLIKRLNCGIADQSAAGFKHRGLAQNVLHPPIEHHEPPWAAEQFRRSPEELIELRLMIAIGHMEKSPSAQRGLLDV